MLSCGVDIINVKRFYFLIERYGDRFLKRVFAGEELAYCEGRKNWVECLAGKFAGKEAVIKALGIRGVPLKKIVILNENGVPRLFMEGKRVEGVTLSISHEREFAVAICIGYKEG